MTTQKGHPLVYAGTSPSAETESADSPRDRTQDLRDFLVARLPVAIDDFLQWPVVAQNAAVILMDSWVTGNTEKNGVVRILTRHERDVLYSLFVEFCTQNGLIDVLPGQQLDWYKRVETQARDVIEKAGVQLSIFNVP